MKIFPRLRLRDIDPYLKSGIVYLRVRDHKKGQKPITHCGHARPSNITFEPLDDKRAETLVRSVTFLMEWYAETEEVEEFLGSRSFKRWRSIKGHQYPLYLVSLQKPFRTINSTFLTLFRGNDRIELSYYGKIKDFVVSIKETGSFRPPEPT
ncbi:MAG: hypothetical protein V4481_02595 [Patescibacteria group bacterium]